MKSPKRSGSPFDASNKDLSKYIDVIRSGRDEVQANGDFFKAFSPIVIGRTKTPWAVMIDVPR